MKGGGPLTAVAVLAGALVVYGTSAAGSRGEPEPTTTTTAETSASSGTSSAGSSDIRGTIGTSVVIERVAITVSSGLWCSPSPP